MSRPFALLLVVLLLAGNAVLEAADRPPNVVLILSDDQAWNDYGFMGHDVIETPHLDRLASQSAVFRNGYVPTSLCRPSLMTCVTGLYPHQHKITGNDPPNKQMDRNVLLKHIRNAKTLPGLLGEHGYKSLQTGKWWEGAPSEGGFTHAMTHGDVSRGGRHGDVGLKIGREGMAPITEFLDEVGEQPFFIWYAPFMPHTPHTPPERLLNKYLAKVDSPHVAAYYAMCEWFDETCGELLGELDRRGLADNTLVLYVCDNGWIQKPEARGYTDKSKRSPYDGGLRTPIMLRWPGHIRPQTIDTPINSIDLAPTALAACGVSIPEELPGTNLLGVASGNKAVELPDAVFGATFEHDMPDIDDPAAGLLYRWCRHGNWKLIVSVDDQVELYDLATDAWETKNLAAENSDVVAQLRARLDAWWPGT